MQREYRKNATKQALEKAHRRVGFSDLLSYLLLLDASTVMHKDGSLSRHYHYLAPEALSQSDSALDFHAQTWSRALQKLGDGWMVETNVLTQPLQYSQRTRPFPEVASALIDDERRLQYQSARYFQTTYYLSLTWKPGSEVRSKLARFTRNTPPAQKSLPLSDDVHHFTTKANEFVGYLQRSLVFIRPLTDAQLTSFLYQCVSGTSQRLAKPDHRGFLNHYLAHDDFIGGYQPKIGQQEIHVLALDDLPSFSYPNLLECLSYFPLTYRWSSRFFCCE